MVVVAFGLALAGCGDDDRLSGDAYRGQLNLACAELYAPNQLLPSRQVEKDLTVDEAKALGAPAADDFVAKLEALDPPEELEDEHETLLEQQRADRRLPGGDAQIGAYIAGFAARYDAVGADRCVLFQQRTIEHHQQAAR